MQIISKHVQKSVNVCTKWVILSFDASRPPWLYRGWVRSDGRRPDRTGVRRGAAGSTRTPESHWPWTARTRAPWRWLPPSGRTPCPSSATDARSSRGPGQTERLVSSWIWTSVNRIGSPLKWTTRLIVLHTSEILFLFFYDGDMPHIKSQINEGKEEEEEEDIKQQ